MIYWMHLKRLLENVIKALITTPKEDNALDFYKKKTVQRDPKCLLSLPSLKTITFH